MIPTSIVVLHGGIGEVTVLVYLLRVVLYLVAFGVLAVAVFWGLELVRAIHSGGLEASVDSEEASVDGDDTSVGRESDS